VATRRIGPTEKQFTAAVAELAKSLGWRTWHDAATNHARRCPRCGEWTAGARNPPGLPDLLLVRPPRLVFAELKVGKGKPTEMQLAYLADLSKSGAEVYLWRDTDMETIAEVLAR
jgi:hypothetical protein